MRGKNYIALFASSMMGLAIFMALMGCIGIAAPSCALAAELPMAAGSPLTGISFDDRPLLLPVQRNFQMAMLTASSQIGRSCGRMEAYGWRVSQTEQHRVNAIFGNAVARLRSVGYTVEAQTPSEISKDITLFTADKSNKHFIFMWSAGEIGLVMVLCESSPPLTGHMTAIYGDSQNSAIPTQPQEVVQSNLEPASANKGHKLYDASSFTPYGDWVGNYTCMRGYTGATMHIDKFKGEDFKGTLRFYPTAKNPYIPKGSYTIYGQYDKESKRILINPGKWIEHPTGYYKTIIIGNFDPVQRSFSGFFQGIMGCTSFEARSDVKSSEVAPKKVGAKHSLRHKHVKSKKKEAEQSSVIKEEEPQPVKNPTPDEALEHAPVSSSNPSAIPPTSTVPGPAVSPPLLSAPPPTPPAAAPVPIVPVPAPAPSSAMPRPLSAMPIPTNPASAMPSSAPPPSSTSSAGVVSTPNQASAASSVQKTVPSSVPAPPVSTSPSPATPVAPFVVQPSQAPESSVPAPDAAPIPKSQPTSSLIPRHDRHIMLVRDWPVTSGPPSLPLASTFSPNVRRYAPAQSYNLSVGQIQKPREYPENVYENPPTGRYNENIPRLQEATEYNTRAREIPPATTYYSETPASQPARNYDKNIPEWPEAQSYTIYKAPGT